MANRFPSGHSQKKGSGKAVSRILSSPSLDGGEGHLSGRPIPGIGLLSQLWNGPFLDPLFGLAPGEVFRAPTLACRAVGSYPAFSPLPPIASDPRRFIFCGTVCRPALSGGSPACIPGRAGVTRPRALESSDFPPAAELRATFRLPGTADTLEGESEVGRLKIDDQSGQVPFPLPSPTGTRPSLPRAVALQGRHPALLLQ